MKPTFVVSAPRCRHENFHAEETCDYQVAWQINPHMRVGLVKVDEAISQHEEFSQALVSAGAELLCVPFVHGAFDSVFIKDNAVLSWRDGRPMAMLANMKHAEREVEQDSRRDAFENLGFKVTGTCEHSFEGGDLVVFDKSRIAFLGHGIRSDRLAAPCIEKFLNIPVIPLELVDPHFYHLDTALTILSDGTAFAFEGAFTPESWNRLLDCEHLTSVNRVLREDALLLGLNFVEVDDTVIMGVDIPAIAEILLARGKNVHVVPLQQYAIAGGNAACLIAKIHESYH